jgi:Fe-S-cluster containining protein
MISRQEFFRIARKSPDNCLTTEQLYSAYEVYRTCPKVSASGIAIRGITAPECFRCGNCCRKPWRIEVAFHDVLRWIREKRFDIISSLEYSPRKSQDNEDIHADLKQAEMAASQLAGLDADILAKSVFMVYISASSEGCLIIPKNNGCIFHDDGEISSCAIHDTKPEVCERFPDII